MADAHQLTQLSNGMRVVTRFMPHVGTVSMGVWVDVGSRYELIEEGGIAHFLEHMAFKGTARRSAFDIVREIEAVGGDLNASTSQEVTSYYVTLLKNDWRLGVDILADISKNSVFPEEEIEREREVVLQEIYQTEDTPDDVVFELAQRVAFPDQALGRPILGPKENVRGFDKQALETFTKKHYAAERMIFSAAGHIDHAALVEAVEAALGDIRPQAQTTYEKGAYQGGEARLTKPFEQRHLVYGFEGISVADPDYYVAQSYASLLGGGMASRLFQEVREKRGLVYGISSFAPTYRDAGVFCVYTSTSQNVLQDIIGIIREEIEKTAHQVTEEELNRAKNQLKAHLLVAQESTSHWMGTLARQLLHFGQVRPTDKILGMIDAITPEAAQAFAQRLLKGKTTLSYVGPST